jgi:hypothetical protein
MYISCRHPFYTVGMTGQENAANAISTIPTILPDFIDFFSVRTPFISICKGSASGFNWTVMLCTFVPQVNNGPGSMVERSMAPAENIITAFTTTASSINMASSFHGRDGRIIGFCRQEHPPPLPASEKQQAGQQHRDRQGQDNAAFCSLGKYVIIGIQPSSSLITK